MGEARPICWVDGRVRPRGAGVVRADDGAFAEGRGCYTSVRIDAGKPRFEDRHLRRLRRGAEALGFQPFEPERVRHALAALAREAFDDGEGIVRVQLSRDAEGGVHVVAVPRGLGHDPSEWSAISAPVVHEGPILVGGHKLTNRLVFGLAGDAARSAGVEEALLFDRAGRLVEGTRCNVVVLRADGRLVTPPLSRGGVAGVGLEVLLERVAELRQRDVSAADLHNAREVLMVNSVRGARPVSQLDGRTVGTGERDAHRQLHSILAAG